MKYRCVASEAVATLMAAFTLIGCGSGDVVTDESVGTQAAPLSQPGTQPTPLARPSVREWEKAMSKTSLPKKGCFRAIQPTSDWEEVPCINSPSIPHLRTKMMRGLLGNGARPQTAGQVNSGGTDTDFSAQVFGTLSSVVGSFPSVIGLRSESDDGRDNYFSLQINSNVFSQSATACGACDGHTGCFCWQQFILDNVPSFLSLPLSTIYMQYWMINFGPSCPSGGWTAFSGPGVPPSCFRNSGAFPIGFHPITDLANITLTATAVPGGSDMVIFSQGNGTLQASASDSQFNLSQAWNVAEFNVFGNGNGTEAIFNDGTTLVVRTSVTNGTTASPTCLGGEPGIGSTTGETSSLGLVPRSCCSTGGPSPAIEFTESNAGATAPFCLLNDIVPIETPLW